MSTLTGKDLNLVKPALTDDHKVTIGTDLPANFQKIDDEFTAHLAEFEPHPSAQTLKASSQIEVTSTSDATSVANAPLKSAGGLAVAKKAFFGDSINIKGMQQASDSGTYNSVPHGSWVDLFTLKYGLTYVSASISAVGHNDATFSSVAIFLKPSDAATSEQMLHFLKGVNATSFTELQIVNGKVQAKQTSGVVQNIIWKSFKIF